MSTVTERGSFSAEKATGILEDYAQRGVFRAFSRGTVRNGNVEFKILWHRDRLFDVVFDANKNLLRFKHLLPNVPADSPMYAEFKKFLKSRQSEELPEHRRIDKQKADIRPYNRTGNVSLTIKSRDGDCDYAVRRIVHLVNEIFLVFLSEGAYFEYMVENFNLDPG